VTFRGERLGGASASMGSWGCPLLEDDFDSRALIEPSEVVHPGDVPPGVVLCFFAEVISSLRERVDARVICEFPTQCGVHLLWEFEHRGHRVGVLHPGVGAPLAAALLEEVIALGSRSFVAVGGCGALIETLQLGQLVVVGSAVRDEGTSFHYLHPSRVVQAGQMGVEVLRQTLMDANADFRVGRSWTTDAFYRETRNRADRRVAEGCVTVEMEAAALFAVAEYRKVRLAQLLYVGDSLAGPVWQERSWSSAYDVRQEAFWLAVNACIDLQARG